MSRDASTKISKKENKTKISEKLTKSQVGGTLELMLKKQNESKSAKAITELILLLEKNWEEDQTSTFLLIYKKEQDKEFSRVNFTKQDLLHILAMAIYKANAINPSDFSSLTLLNVKELEIYE